MKKTTGQLHGELMNSLYQFTKDLGYHLPPDKIFDTTTSLIDVFVNYERYRESIHQSSKKVLSKSIGMLPIEKQKELRRGTDNKKMYYSHKRVNLNLNKKDGKNN